MVDRAGDGGGGLNSRWRISGRGGSQPPNRGVLGAETRMGLSGGVWRPAAAGDESGLDLADPVRREGTGTRGGESRKDGS